MIYLGYVISLLPRRPGEPYRLEVLDFFPKLEFTVQTIRELVPTSMQVIDDYLTACKEKNIKPQPPRLAKMYDNPY